MLSFAPTPPGGGTSAKRIEWELIFPSFLTDFHLYYFSSHATLRSRFFVPTSIRFFLHVTAVALLCRELRGNHPTNHGLA